MPAQRFSDSLSHGRALARLENYGMALTALRRAVSLSPKVGSRAAEAAFAVFQEMEERLAVIVKSIFYGSNPVGTNI